MIRLAEMLADRPFIILAVNVGEEKRKLPGFVKKMEEHMVILLDTDSSAFESWKGIGLPSTFVLDPDTGENLPRTGRVTGRAAFFDLGAECHWGGFITGDEITVNWTDFCSCGRQSHFIEGQIERYSDKRGGDDKINCAATENAHKEALDFLTDFGQGT